MPRTSIEQLKREALAGLAKLDATLTKLASEPLITKSEGQS